MCPEVLMFLVGDMCNSNEYLSKRLFTVERLLQMFVVVFNFDCFNEKQEFKL